MRGVKIDVGPIGSVFRAGHLLGRRLPAVGEVSVGVPGADQAGFGKSIPAVGVVNESDFLTLRGCFF